MSYNKSTHQSDGVLISGNASWDTFNGPSGSGNDYSVKVSTTGLSAGDAKMTIVAAGNSSAAERLSYVMSNGPQNGYNMLSSTISIQCDISLVSSIGYGKVGYISGQEGSLEEILVDSFSAPVMYGIGETCDPGLHNAAQIPTDTLDPLLTNTSQVEQDYDLATSASLIFSLF